MPIRENTVVRFAVTGVALALLGGHLLFPDQRIDLLTLGFLVVAVVPWLSSILESFELPGGWKVKYRDLKLAGDVVVAASAEKYSQSATRAGFAPSPVPTIDDPSVQLVALRIEIEKRLRELGSKHGVEVEKRSPAALLHALADAGVLELPLHNSLALVVQAGNQAAHGARVSAAVGKWAATIGPVILRYLDAKLREANSK